MPNNFKIVNKFVDSKIMEGKNYHEGTGHSFALGALEGEVSMLLVRLEIYHPDAYNSVVGMFDTQEEAN